MTCYRYRYWFTCAVLAALALVAGCGGGEPAEDVVVSSEPTPEIVYLDQGWTDAERREFYHKSQGSQLFRWDWLLAMEQRGIFEGEPFIANDYLVENFRFIADEMDPVHNPDGVPIGFAKDVDPEVMDENGAPMEYFGFTCAMCHTQQISYQGTEIRIDGGPAAIDINTFANAMVVALGFTDLPLHFRRFADRILGEDHTSEEQDELRAQLTELVAQFGRIAFQTITGRLAPTESGFRRLDALGKGGNTLFGQINPENVAPITGHVAFPELWDAPWFDWAEYAGAIWQPMGRNVAEALGVYARVTFTGDPADHYKSTVRVENIDWIENQLRKLKSPPWPEEILGALDQERVARGAELYQELCASCHTFDRYEQAGGTYLEVKMIDLEDVGTDPTMLMNFAGRKVDMGELGQGVLSGAEALTVITDAVKQRRYADLGLSPERIDEMECCFENRFRAEPRLRGRPLNGAWASAPYLHNGSVPNMYQLLGPAETRSATFWVGHSEYDPMNLGYTMEQVDGDWEFNTSIEGNSNAGHEFKDGPTGNGVVGRALSNDERYAIIEYVKSLTDDIAPD